MDNWQLVLIACCILPTALVMAAVYFAVRAGGRLINRIAPAEDQLIDEFVALRKDNPDVPTQKLVNRLINRQSMRAGVIGAVTSMGGAFTLPLGLPADLLTTGRIQSSTLQMIAWAYELENPGSVPKVLSINDILGLKQGGKLDLNVNDLTQQLVLSQSDNFTAMATRRALLVVGEKAFAKLIPGLGLLIGFAVNYLMMRGAAQLAVAWYSGNIQNYGSQIKAARESLGSGAVAISPMLRDAGQTLNRQTAMIRQVLKRESPSGAAVGPGPSPEA